MRATNLKGNRLDDVGRINLTFRRIKLGKPKSYSRDDGTYIKRPGTITTTTTKKETKKETG